MWWWWRSVIKIEIHKMTNQSFLCEGMGFPSWTTTDDVHSKHRNRGTYVTLTLTHQGCRYHTRWFKAFRNCWCLEIFIQKQAKIPLLIWEVKQDWLKLTRMQKYTWTTTTAANHRWTESSIYLFFSCFFGALQFFIQFNSIKMYCLLCLKQLQYISCGVLELLKPN